jgi:hypothetical protein
MNRKRTRAAIAIMMAALLIVGLGSVVQAAPRKIHACVDKAGKNKGDARIVKATTRCKRSEARIKWNVQGVRGLRGRRGYRGPAGADGSDGVSQAGAPGSSAYDLWLESHPGGTEGQFLTSLEGEDGTDGTDGASILDLTDMTLEELLASLEGEDGTDGTDGEDFLEWVARSEFGSLGELLQSLKGEIGATGAKGDKGDNGARGPDGAPGLNGGQGPKGDNGARGPDGAPGLNGGQGPKGDQGTDGPRGLVGPNGEIGPPGLRGTDGPPGRDGKDGMPGRTAFEQAKYEWENDAESEVATAGAFPYTTVGSWIRSLKGAEGARGPQGNPGGWGVIMKQAQSAEGTGDMSADVTCPDNFVAVGGGASDSAGKSLSKSHPRSTAAGAANGWHAESKANGSTRSVLSVFALCAPSQ